MTFSMTKRRKVSLILALATLVVGGFILVYFMFIRADIILKGENLLVNSDFQDLDTNGFAENWIHSSAPKDSGGTETIVTDGCLSGRCLRMKPGDIDPATGNSKTTSQATSQTISLSKLEPGQYYLFSALYKTGPYHNAYVNFQNVADKKSITTRTTGGTNDWQKVEKVVQIPSQNASDIKIILYGTSPKTNADAIYIDNVSFALIGDKDPYAIVPLGPTNDDRTIDFGSDKNLSYITSDPDTFSPTQETDPDSGIKYRSIQSTKKLTVQIPAASFRVDEQGLPDSPAVLEIKYQDVINAKDEKIDSRDRHRAFVRSFINYLGDTDLSSQQDKKYYTVGGLGEDGGGAWKVAQILFDKSQFQLIRAIDGKFTFDITMPNLNDADKTLKLPLNYISLQAVSQEDYDNMTKKDMDRNGFYYVPPLEAEPSGIDYPDSKLVLFNRDMMQQVYDGTLPQLNEILNDGQVLSSTTAINETEVLNVGLHSPEGIKGLNFEVASLTNEAGATILPDDITIDQVIYDYKRITQSIANGTPYSYVPDRLEQAKDLSIEPKKTKRLWIKITPKTGGTYTGDLKIKQGDKVLRSVPLKLNVLPFQLDHSAQINVLADPFYKVVSPDISKTLDFYSGTDLDLHIASIGATVTKDLAGNFTFDFSEFSKRIQKLADQGILKDNDRAVLRLEGTVEKIYGALYPNQLMENDSNLWQHLSDQTFENALNQAVSQIEVIGAGTNRVSGKNLTFIYQEGDEPGNDPLARVDADRVYTILHKKGRKTTITYDKTCNDPVDGTSLGIGTIPALNNTERRLVDYEDWALTSLKTENNVNLKGNGFYTTYYTQLRNMDYDRFYHGAYAYGTGVEIAYGYTIGDWINAPFNDFDRSVQNVFSSTMPYDYLIAYSTWRGDVLPTMAAEGIREGIKDSKYFATLERLIGEHPGTKANEAKAYLESIKAKVKPNYNSDYASKGGTYGHYPQILSDLSGGNPEDYKVFTDIRNTVIGYIEDLTKIEPSDNNKRSSEGDQQSSDQQSSNGSSSATSTPSTATSKTSEKAFPTKGIIGSSITFDATNLFSGKNVVRYVWDFGDSANGEGGKIDHIFKDPGRYTINITGYDKDNNNVAVAKTIDIYPTSPIVTNITSVNNTDLRVEGTAYHNDIIYLSLQSNPINVQSQVDANGKWTYVFTNVSGTIGNGDHTASAIDSFKLADNTELKSDSSKTYDFKVSFENGKVQVEKIEKTTKDKWWEIIAYVSGGIILLIGIIYGVFWLRRKRAGYR